MTKHAKNLEFDPAGFEDLAWWIEKDRKKARKAVDELLALVPDFKSRGPSLIRRFAYLDEHIELLVEGLGKAGLKMQSKVIDAT